MKLHPPKLLKWAIGPIYISYTEGHKLQLSVYIHWQANSNIILLDQPLFKRANTGKVLDQYDHGEEEMENLKYIELNIGLTSFSQQENLPGHNPK